MDVPCHLTYGALPSNVGRTIHSTVVPCPRCWIACEGGRRRIVPVHRRDRIPREKMRDHDNIRIVCNARCTLGVFGWSLAPPGCHACLQEIHVMFNNNYWLEHLALLGHPEHEVQSIGKCRARVAECEHSLRRAPRNSRKYASKPDMHKGRERVHAARRQRTGRSQSGPRVHRIQRSVRAMRTRV